MLKRFVAAREDQPDGAWQARFTAGRDEAVGWYLGNDLAEPPTASACRAALARHMPELVPQYDRACSLVGDDDIAHRVLSHYRPPPTIHGCSQAVWLGDRGPALVRNYDFPLDIVSDRFEATAWLGQRVIAKTQRPWGGCLDGMNEAGLVASLTAGGSRAQGLGFSIILVLRYVLETCRNVAQPVAALRRIPVALSQNVTLLDRSGAFATVFLRPDRAPEISLLRACTNHQDRMDAPASAALASSVQRQNCLLAALEEPAMTLAEMTSRFFTPPLYSRRAGFTTVYTAVYRPAERTVDYLWPGKRWTQGFDRFMPGEYTHDYGHLTP